jgi:hypothetical protein
MKSLLMLETQTNASKLVSILHYNGMPIPSESIVTAIGKHIESEAAA